MKNNISLPILKNKIKPGTKHRLILSGLLLIMVLLFTRFKFAYGSALDWGSQHYVFPGYFRELFYDTRDPFPDFAPNIGAGENIYNFSYYGLYSPVILLSYFFPFLEMPVYIQLISIIEVWVTLMLLYGFLSRRYSSFAAFAATLSFMFTSIYIFNSHRHIMFVSNMPFIILSFEAADKFIKEGKRALLILCMALMILCNYFFSVPALISVSVYAVYSYLKHNERFDIKGFAVKGIGYTLCVFTSIMICAVMLLPSFATVLKGRDSRNEPFDITLLIPRMILGISANYPLGMGITAFGVIAVVSAVMCGEKSRRFLGVCIAAINIFPVSALLLNGGMYAEGKVFIPFVPLLIILAAEKFDEYRDGVKTGKAVYIVSGLAVLESLLLYQKKYDYAEYIPLLIFGADIVIFVIFFAFYLKTRKKALLLAASLTVSASVAFLSGLFDSPMSFEKLKYVNSEEIRSYADAAARDPDLVRSAVFACKSDTVNIIYNMDYYTAGIYSSINNMYYKNFYFDTIHNENEYRNSALMISSLNPLFNIFMGNKYIITDNDAVMTGYELISRGKAFGFYKNDAVLPVGRSSDKLISEKYFDSLSDVEQMEAIVKYIVVDDDSIDSKCVFTNEKYELPLFQESDRLRYNGNGFTVKSSGQWETAMRLTKPLTKDKLLVILMDVDNFMSDTDARIKINGMQNTLTCSEWKYFNNNRRFEYVISTGGEESTDKLDFVFSEGEFNVSNIECYLIDYPYDVELTGKFMADKRATKGDVISGSIDCERDSFFELTVPCDEGFEVTVDGKRTDYQCVDKAFIGFELPAGRHDIKIEYRAPLKKEGLMLSGAGILILLALASFELYKKMKSRR